MVVMERFFLPEGIFIFTDTRTFVKIFNRLYETINPVSHIERWGFVVLMF